MKNIFIISSNFYDVSSSIFTIGGIQTYIKDLCLAVNRGGHKATLIQFGQYREKEYIYADGCEILLYPLDRNNQRTFDALTREYDSKESVFIIDTDQRGITSNCGNVIQIQHGVTFDIPGDMIPGIWGKTPILQRINKQLRCWRNASRLFHVRNTVCVDYNYYNWFRTQDTIPNRYRVKVIPNYASSILPVSEIETKLRSSSHKLRIVFARRFVDYRGTRLMIEASKKVLALYENVEITFAGEGPLRGEIESSFMGCERVRITSYNSNDSVSFHYKFDIAVIPTVYSEGTSLSLCEAMAAGCLPIASCVGGMSNVLINGFNGFLIQPGVEELIESLITAIEMPHELRSIISKRAYETASTAFSKSRWEQQWLDFLGKIF